MSQKTVTINGTIYDAQTGMPIETEVKATPATTATHPTKIIKTSQSVHRTTQKSQTLNRRIVKKTTESVMAQQKTIKKSPAITKFAPHPVAIKKSQAAPDIAPVTHHPLAAKAQRYTTLSDNITAAPKPASVIKREAIAEAMSAAPGHHTGGKQIKHPRKLQRMMSVGSMGLALLLLAGYFTYLNMPSLSVRVAAAQAGVDASYPEYHPDGYRVGAIGFKQDEVQVKFASNSGPQNFTITQKKSGWDSSAVLDNHVKQQVGDNYITYSERGLTIYTYGSDAAWVNNGVLYTINGDAPLSSDQIRHIATSM